MKKKISLFKDCLNLEKEKYIFKKNIEYNSQIFKIFFVLSLSYLIWNIILYFEETFIILLK